MPETRWTTPPWPPRLELATVDVWRADLGAAWVAERELLSDAERERAARFLREEDGRRWAASRGILRALLGAYLDADPHALGFAEGPHGKPRLATPAPAAAAGGSMRGGGESTDAARLRFNLSHSGDVALYAVTTDREVGVDVELPRRPVEHVAIARRILGDAEAERLAALEPPGREREFLRAWVRYEAALKCRGTGIGGADSGSADGPEPWLCELDPGAPAAAALAVAGGPHAVRRLRWPADVAGAP